MRIFYSIFILLFWITSCNQRIEIAGHWRPADAFQETRHLNIDTPLPRDLVLNSDSTFISIGLDRQPKKTVGWSNDATQKGKWSFAGGILSLTFQDVSYPVKFKVLKITKEELIMESEMMKAVELRLMRIRN
ncbi:hypothetical protein IQ13_3054 [Lacibacter cauensis]|uniref:Lipocalin-like protein n=1 Tax=Lacibacter cauensis TaxID=510947 RepID=A0A562SGC4_9BACT|nr:hypothetical protein [Lacibacter cauensis]TWI80377.1 hypothetical protein IQ13_3054 [Lacibacter cauensis]